MWFSWLACPLKASCDWDMQAGSGMAKGRLFVEVWVESRPQALDVRRHKRPSGDQMELLGLCRIGLAQFSPPCHIQG